MTLPTREQLYAETDRKYFLQYPSGPRVIDPDDVSQDPYEAAWLQIRDEVLYYWTDDVFKKFFPTAGRLDAGDDVLIDYWNDIKEQISGRPGRWSWDTPPDAKPITIVEVTPHEQKGGLPRTILRLPRRGQGEGDALAERDAVDGADRDDSQHSRPRAPRHRGVVAHAARDRRHVHAGQHPDRRLTADVTARSGTFVSCVCSLL